MRKFFYIVCLLSVYFLTGFVVYSLFDLILGEDKVHGLWAGLAATISLWIVWYVNRYLKKNILGK